MIYLSFTTAESSVNTVRNQRSPIALWTYSITSFQDQLQIQFQVCCRLLDAYMYSVDIQVVGKSPSLSGTEM